MKYLKKFNESAETYNRDDYLWLPLFCARSNRVGPMDLDIAVFCDINVGGSGYGLSLRGDYFDKSDFNDAMSKKGDCLRRKLYTINDIDILIKDFGLDNLPKKDAIEKIIERIKSTRDGYCSADPNGERAAGVYVELDEIEDLLK